jgi:hypothetical protein
MAVLVTRVVAVVDEGGAGTATQESTARATNEEAPPFCCIYLLIINCSYLFAAGICTVAYYLCKLVKAVSRLDRKCTKLMKQLEADYGMEKRLMGDFIQVAFQVLLLSDFWLPKFVAKL